MKDESIQVILEGTIHAPVENVFPLCCPVEEYKWIDGWKCNLIHCPNNKVEQGTIFQEKFSAPFLLGKVVGKTVWTAVLHKAQNFELHFKLENAVSSSLYKIKLSDDGSHVTKTSLDFTYKALNEKGRKIIASNGREKIHLMLSVIAQMLKYYSETGEMLKASVIRKMIMNSDKLRLRDKVRLALNRFAIFWLKD